MTDIDYKAARLEEREKFSFTKSQREEFYSKLRNYQDVQGAVLISTCNRTELYLSLEEGSKLEPFQVLCDFLKLNSKELAHVNNTLENDDAIRHLCRVSAGAESQILGDDQIISQVRDSACEAKELGATDSIMNVVFRTGVSAGKKVKTVVDFKIDDSSSAIISAKIAKREGAKKALVIGNGQIGRAVTEELLKRGIETTVTLRQYRYGKNIVPEGASTINYGDRYSLFGDVDVVISATTSPHYTVSLEEVEKLDACPRCFVDLAVPRDIDPRIEERFCVKCFNIDNLLGEERQ